MAAKRRTKAQIEADKKAKQDAAIASYNADAKEINSADAEVSVPEVTGGSHENLAKAMMAAHSEVVAVLKDKKHHTFGWYSSSENVLRYSKLLLQQNGIFVRGSGRSIWFSDKDQPIMTSNFTVTHAESGESFTDEFDLPIQETGMKGEVNATMSDAALQASTISWGYYLRDLLMIPRLAEGEDIAPKGQTKEHFTTPQPLPGPTGVKVETPAGPATVTEMKPVESETLEIDGKELDVVKDRIKRTGGNEAAIKAHYKVGSLALLNRPQYKHLMKVLEGRQDVTEVTGKFSGAQVTNFTTTPAPEGSEPGKAPEELTAQPISPGQLNLLKLSITSSGKTEADFLQQYPVGALENTPASILNEAMLWLRA